jgi:CBS domain-containing protein
MSEWRDLVRNTKVKDILRPTQKVVTSRFNEPLVYVFNLLKENNILSVPVTKDDKPIGFLDTLDVCQYLVHVWRQQRDAATGEVDTHQLPEKVSSAKVQQFINYSGRDDYRHIREDASLEECLNMMNEQGFKFHRLAVHNADNRLIGIVSQSDIMMYAGQHLEQLPKSDMSLKDLRLTRGVVTMRADIILGDTLEALSTKGISALALVDVDGKLVANFSASDLRGLTRAVFSWFDKPTIDFLKHFGRGPKPPIVQSPDTTLKDCAKELARLSKEERIHRLYLVDNDNRPVGVVSLSDIMPLLIPQATPTAQEAH